MSDPFDPFDFGYPLLFPDPLEEQLRDFHHMNLMMDQCERFTEQPPLPGDWRSQDALGLNLATAEMNMELDPILAPEPLNQANIQEECLSIILTMLESQIEGTVILGPTPPPEIPSTNPLMPGGLVRRDNPLAEEGNSSFYPGLSNKVRYQVGASRSGTRRSEEGIWCFDQERYVQRETDCEGGCSHWDSESMECRYFEDWERDHSDEGD